MSLRPAMGSRRRCDRTSRFERDLDRLSRKHPGFRATVEQALSLCTSARRAPGDRIPGTGGHGYVVLKFRLPLDGKGRATGARLIYARNEERVVALFIYAKGDRENIGAPVVLDALRRFGLPA